MSIPVLLVEDDKNLGYILSEYLSLKGFEITWAKDGNEAIAMLEKIAYRLCILDVMLPHKDGFSVAEKIAELELPLPFIFLTAKTLKVEKLKGFKLGCDDYISKPVDEEELVARMNAVLKRSRPEVILEKGRVLRVGMSTLDLNMRTLEINKIQYLLKAKEADLLFLLMSNKNTVLDRELVLQKLWGSDNNLTRRNMDVLISRLRKHLTPDKNISIANVHNKGHILREEITR